MHKAMPRQNLIRRVPPPLALDTSTLSVRMHRLPFSTNLSDGMDEFSPVVCPVASYLSGSMTKEEESDGQSGLICVSSNEEQEREYTVEYNFLHHLL
jgi:hypothetical protein